MKKSLCFRKSSVNPSIEYAKGSTDNQSDPSNLNQRSNQPAAYSLQSMGSILPVGRIGTCFIVVLFSAHCLVALPSKDEMNQETAVIANCKSPTSNSNDENDEDFFSPVLMGGPTDRLEVRGYRLEEAERALSDNTITNCESPTVGSKDESTKKFLNPALMGGTANLTTTAARWLFKTGSNKIVTRPFVGLGGAVETPSKEYLNALTHYQSDFSNLNRCTDQSAAFVRPIGRIVSTAAAVPTTYHLPPPASFWPIGRIVSTAAAVSPASFRPVSRIITRPFSSGSSTKEIEPTTALNKETEGSDFQKISELNFKASDARIKAETTTGDISYCWKEVADSYQKSIEYWEKSCQAQKAEKTTLAAGYREAAIISEYAANQRKLAAETKAKGKESEGNSWGWVGDSLQKKADYQAKACEAQEAGKITLATSYREAAITSELAADQWRLSAETKAVGKEGEGISWGNAGKSLQTMADYQAKASEVEEAGKTTLATSYREAAITSEHAADQWKLSAKTKAAGKTNEGNSWGWVGDSLQKKADYQAKACEAQEAGKITLAAGYRETAIISEYAASQRKLAAETKAAGKMSEGNSWGWVGDSLQKKAAYQAKACEAQEAGKITLAAGYREAAIISEQASNYHKQSALVSVAGKESESPSWFNAGKSLQKKADYQAKACEAEKVGKLILATGYREAATISGYAAEQYKLSAEAKAKGKEELGIIRNIEGQSFQSQADYQAKACEAGEAGKTNLCIGYKEGVTILQRAINQFQEAAEAQILEKISQSAKHYHLGVCFQTKANYQIKASEAEESTKTILATGYREANFILQYAIDQFQKGIQAEAAGKEDESRGWYGASTSLQSQADYQAKASEAQENGKETLAVAYKESALISGKAAELSEQEALKKAAGKTDEGKNCGIEGECLQLQADYQAKAVEEREAGREMLAEGYKEAAETSQRAAGIKNQAGEAIASGKGYVGNSLSWAGQSLKLKAEHQVKLIEAKELEKEVLAVRYREVVETLQKASEYYQQAADIFAVEKIDKAYDYYLTGEYFRLEAENQAKANEAEEAEKEVLGAVYREVVLTPEREGRLGEQEAEKKILEKKNEGEICAMEEECFQLKEDYKIKAIKAKEAGREILSEGYKEAVLTLERVVGQYQLAAKAKAEGQEDQRSHWSWSGDLLQAKASYQIKVSKALELGNATLAAYYREAATTSQRAAEQHELIVQGLMEKWDGGIIWRIRRIFKFLQPPRIYRVQAFEAAKEGKNIRAFFYRKVASLSQHIVSPSQQSYRDFYNKEWYERQIRSDIANSLKTKVDYEVKAAKAHEEAKRILAASYQRAAATYQRAADLYELVLKNEGASLYSRSDKWYEIGNLLQLKADYHVKACEAEEVGETIFAANYREAVITLQYAIDNFIRFGSRQYNETFSWRSAASAFEKKADYQVKAIEAEKAGEAILAEKYREAVIILQRSADQYMQAAEAYAAKDMGKGGQLFNTAKSLYEGTRVSWQDKMK